MTKYALLMISALALSTSAALAQQSELPAEDQVALPPIGDVQNFLPFIAPVLGIGGIIAAGAGGGSNTSTTSTN